MHKQQGLISIHVFIGFASLKAKSNCFYRETIVKRISFYSYIFRSWVLLIGQSRKAQCLFKHLQKFKIGIIFLLVPFEGIIFTVSPYNGLFLWIRFMWANLSSTQVCTPADWTLTKPAMVDTSTTPDDLNAMFSSGIVTHLLPSGKAYMRTVGSLTPSYENKEVEKVDPPPAKSTDPDMTEESIEMENGEA